MVTGKEVLTSPFYQMYMSEREKAQSRAILN